MEAGVLTMNAFLSHIDMAPLFYGVILAVGIFSMLHKLLSGRFVLFAVEAGVFWLVFSLHKGSLTGGMSAAVASLIVSFVIGPFMRLRR